MGFRCVSIGVCKMPLILSLCYVLVSESRAVTGSFHSLEPYSQESLTGFPDEPVYSLVSPALAKSRTSKLPNVTLSQYLACTLWTHFGSQRRCYRRSSSAK